MRCAYCGKETLHPPTSIMLWHKECRKKGRKLKAQYLKQKNA